MLNYRYVLLDLGSCDEVELGGKDIVFTNAPDSTLREISAYIKTSPDVGLPAEEVFVNQVKASGYNISITASLDDMKIHSCSADTY